MNNRKECNEKQQQDDYVNLFLRVANVIEGMLIKGLIVLFVMLLFTQMLLQVPSIRYALVKVEQLEGVPYSYSHMQVREDP
jgi:hypothetical protein